MVVCSQGSTAVLTKPRQANAKSMQHQSEPMQHQCKPIQNQRKPMQHQCKLRYQCKPIYLTVSWPGPPKRWILWSNHFVALADDLHDLGEQGSPRICKNDCNRGRHATPQVHTSSAKIHGLHGSSGRLVRSISTNFKCVLVKTIDAPCTQVLGVEQPWRKKVKVA
jgi:hypothetical protein